MSRLLALLIVALLLWLLLARLLRLLMATPLGRAVGAAFGAPPPGQQRKRRQISAELVRCAGCGVHVPERQIATRDAAGQPLCAQCQRERRR